MSNYKDWLAYQKAYQLAMQVFVVTKDFPPEERYSLTDQFRRSSRSVCANIAESYKRRKYPNHFISKLNDAEAENAETQVWIDFSYDCKYLSQEKTTTLSSLNEEVSRLLHYMENHPEKFL